MNTSKQVNVMIGLLFLSLLVFGAYILTEPQRESDAREEQEAKHAERGAELFVNNCRNCHGLVGEGHIGPPVNVESFLILGEDNPLGVPETPIGEADRIRDFLTNTLSCGRTGTFMPPWSQEHGGSMSDIQISYLVTLMTTGRWDLVETLGEEHDAETGDAPEDILVQDASALTVTQNNCGQFTNEYAAEIRARDPFAPPGATPPPGATEPPGATGTPGAPTAELGQQLVQQQGCLGCHSTGPDALVGPGWGGLFGSTETLEDGSTVQVDEDYLRESILQPGAKVVEGFAAGIMPSYEGQLTDDEVDAIIEYIKTLQ